jgi:hypothetical protein
LACDVFWAVLERCDRGRRGVSPWHQSCEVVRSRSSTAENRERPIGQFQKTSVRAFSPSTISHLPAQIPTNQRTPKTSGVLRPSPCPPCDSPSFATKCLDSPASKEPSRRARPYAPTPTRFLSPRRFFFSRSFPLSIFQRNGAVRLTLS